MLICSLCGHDDVDVLGKHGAYLYTSCNHCGHTTGPEIQSITARANIARREKKFVHVTTRRAPSEPPLEEPSTPLA